MKAGLFGILIGLLTFSAFAGIPEGKLPKGITPLHYKLIFNIDPDRDGFNGIAEITIRLDTAVDEIYLHGQDLDVGSAIIIANNAEIDATYKQVNDAGVALVTPERSVGPGEISLTLSYEAEYNHSLEGLYKVEVEDESLGSANVFTDFQPLDARRAFPGFDEPRFKTPFEVTVITPGRNDVIANGPEKKTLRLSDGQKQVAFRATRPLPTYLVALAVGQFDIVEYADMPPNAIRSHPVSLRGITPKGKGAQIEYALKNTASMNAILEEYFDIPYPFAKLDLVVPDAFNAGGMENAGAIFYRQNNFLIGENPSIYQQRGFASLHAHELAHNWFGNLVTAAWWDDIWLNEAFATWMSNKVVHEWQPDNYDGRGSIRWARGAMWNDRMASARSIRQPIKSNHDITSAFDSITYSKGGGVLAMIEEYMGEDAFRAGVRRFIKLHMDGVATADDFFAALSDDPEIIAVFKSFVEQPGVPLVETDWSCSNGNTLDIDFKQVRSLPLGSKGDADKFWNIPVCIAHSGGKQCALVDKKKQRLSIAVDSCPEWVLPNANGSAYMNFTFPADKWGPLVERLGTMPAGDALGLLGSIYAAFEAGSIDLKTVFRASEIAATSPHWDVVSAAQKPYQYVQFNVLSENEAKQLVKESLRVFAPTLARFDTSYEGLKRAPATTEESLMRGDLIWFMALHAYDPELREKFTEIGKHYIGFGTDNRIHSDGVHPDFVRIALLVAAEELGPDYFEALIDHMKTTDNATLKEHIKHALAYQTRPDKVKRVQKLILDPDTAGSDASGLLWRQAKRAYNAGKIFDWLTENYEAVVTKVPRSHRAWLVWRGSRFCTTEDRDRVAAFFVDKSYDYPGGPRAFKNVIETIEICSGIRERYYGEAVSIFSP